MTNKSKKAGRTLYSLTATDALIGCDHLEEYGSYVGGDVAGVRLLSNIRVVATMPKESFRASDFGPDGEKIRKLEDRVYFWTPQGNAYFTQEERANKLEVVYLRHARKGVAEALATRLCHRWAFVDSHPDTKTMAWTHRQKVCRVVPCFERAALLHIFGFFGIPAEKFDLYLASPVYQWGVFIDGRVTSQSGPFSRHAGQPIRVRLGQEWCVEWASEPMLPSQKSTVREPDREPVQNFKRTRFDLNRLRRT